MAKMRAMVSLLGASVALANTDSLLDAVSAVQGLVRAHQHDRCSTLLPEEEGEEPLTDVKKEYAEVVVVRGSGEDLRWLDAVSEIPAVVYDRNGMPELLPKPRSNLRILPQPNVGREDEGIIRHIVDNYNSLPEYSVFLQGWPFWHCAGTLDMIRRGIKNAAKPADLDFIATGALPGLVPLAGSFYKYSLKAGTLGNWITLTSGAHYKNHMTVPEAKEEAVRTFNQTCRKILGSPCPNEHWVAEGSQWVVSRNRIQKRPLSFYQELLNMTFEGDHLHKTRLRGLVLEAIWPALWGVSEWSPGQQVNKAINGKQFVAEKRTDSMGSYCTFGTDRMTFPAAVERRGVCELEKQASGMGSKVLLNSNGVFEPWIKLRAVHGHMISKEAMLAGSSLPQAHRPKRTYTNSDGLPFCLKRHIWPTTMSTRLRNQASGKCVERGTGFFGMQNCGSQAYGQMLRVNTNGNGGFIQIMDSVEAACMSHAFGEAKAEICKNGADGGAADHQKWELVQRGNGTYEIKQTDAALCLVQDGGLKKGLCKTPASTWEFLDVANMGQYWKKFEYSVTEFSTGKLGLRCITTLQSSGGEEVNPDLVEPDWRKRGRVLRLQMEVASADGTANSYFLKRDGRYLGCNDVTKDAQMGELNKVAWSVKPVSDGFVYFESSAGVLQYKIAEAKMKCAPLEKGAPPTDATFAIEFPAVSRSKMEL
eukprot:CAMPEP_0171186734 /NCGR_PEP_ID=MMETSP0790-20130122/16964_1 /TAXON_ID=2925 /ORGANISM="Alexandrium catenella, Strain OF101" /LENGTH=702 /DNA_ID=CAMNT_0011651785 /DNA_START=87 /DNA_END=2195 /DNA_ORIENTATION=+